MQSPLLDFHAAFEAMPGNFLLLRPDAPDYTVLAISDGLLAHTQQHRPHVVGRGVLGGWAKEPAALGATEFDDLRSSLDHALQRQELHQLPALRYEQHPAASEAAAQYWAASTKPLRDAAGAVWALLYTLVEVTDQWRAQQREEARRQAATSAQHYRTLLEEAPIATSLFLGPEIRIQYANALMLSYWGKETSVLGLTLREALPELEGQAFLGLLAHVYATGETYVGTRQRATLLINGQPKTSYFTFTYKPLRDEQGRVYGIHHTAVDVTLEVLARQQIEESELRFRSLVEQAPVAITLTRGPNVVIESINAPMLHIMRQATAADVLGKKMVDVLPHIESQAILSIAQAVTDTGKSFRGDEVPIQMLGADDELEQRYFNVSYTPLVEAGVVAGVIHVAIDVTDQVRARQQVEATSEELKRFMFMADQARDPFVLMRADATFAYLNPQALADWGYTAEESRSLRVFDTDPMYQQAAFEELFARAQRGIVAPFDTIHRRKDGQVYPVNVSISGLVLNGEPHLFAIPRDITEQRKFVEALRESEERFRIMADAAPTIVWAVRPDASIRYVNRIFLEFLGVSEAEYLATGWGPYLHPQEAATTAPALLAAIRERAPYVLEHRLRRHDGQYRWLLVQGAPSYYPSGELYGYVGSALDITDLKETNEQLMRANVDLDNFIYTASHDLKAPITNIEGLLGTLADELPATSHVGDVPLVLELMHGSVARFKRTLEHLTDIARLQQQHAQAPTQVGLADVVEDVRQDLLPQLREASAQLDLDVPADVTIRFSVKNLRSVVYNLLSNAIKYRSPDRPALVQLRCTTTAEHHILTVADNGLGLEAGREAQLFGLFKRLHTHVEGSGIGLYMVKKMVENANGRIEVQSQLGHGSTFTVYFPR